MLAQNKIFLVFPYLLQYINRQQANKQEPRCLVTINEAAVEILKEKNKPLSSIEIATIAFSRKLIYSKAKTPIKSLAYTIDKNIREEFYNNPKLIFLQTSIGRLIGLPGWGGNVLNIDLQKSKTSFQKLTISLPSNLMENINLAYQAKIADTYDETLIYIINEGLSKVAHIIKENISKQLEGLNNNVQSKPLGNFQNRVNAISNNVEHRKLGRKGYEQVKDYLIPVIRLMRKGNNHCDAFHIIAEKLDVRYSTVSAQCTNHLGISTNDFIEFVGSGQILRLIKDKFPEKTEMINRDIGELNQLLLNGFGLIK